jgi:hypothetical protein
MRVDEVHFLHDPFEVREFGDRVVVMRMMRGRRRHEHECENDGSTEMCSVA